MKILESWAKRNRPGLTEEMTIEESRDAMEDLIWSVFESTEEGREFMELMGIHKEEDN